MKPGDVRHVGVVGAGLMGSGIVEVVARSGAAVTFVEGSAALVSEGRARIEASLGRAAQRGTVSDDERVAVLARIDGVADLGALADVDLVIEAATEHLEAKLRIFRTLGTVAPSETILASNTSSIPIVELAIASGRPDKVVGLHFFNPPTVMPLLELTPALTTSPETLEFVRAYGSEVLAKTCVQARDEAGFIVNRLLIPYLFDAIRLYEQGFATREDIDTAIHLGLAHPMGPLTLADLIGLDTTLSIGEVLFAEFGDPRFAPPPMLRRLVASGRIGRKSGGGFYDYDAG